MARNETAIDRLRKHVRMNFAKCYWSEDSLTEDNRIPRERCVEPAKFLEQIIKALKRDKPKYLWMVTQDGSYDGDYENCASSTLFLTEGEAIEFVKECIRECVLNDKLVNVTDLDEEAVKEAIVDHVEWFGTYMAQYRNDGSVTDWKIERVPMPKPAKVKKRSKA